LTIHEIARGSLTFMTATFRIPHLDNTIHPVTNTRLLISPPVMVLEHDLWVLPVYKLWSCQDFSHSLSIPIRNLISFISHGRLVSYIQHTWLSTSFYSSPVCACGLLVCCADTHYLLYGVVVIWVITRAYLPLCHSNIHQCSFRFETIQSGPDLNTDAVGIGGIMYVTRSMYG